MLNKEDVTYVSTAVFAGAVLSPDIILANKCPVRRGLDYPVFNCMTFFAEHFTLLGVVFPRFPAWDVVLVMYLKNNTL